MKILLMGPPGCGKGTIGAMLSAHLQVPNLTVGQLLRDLPKTNPRYEQIHTAMAAGDPAPQDFIGDLLLERTSQTDCALGYILDGWGRLLIDFDFFNPSFDLVLVFNISRETAVKRISGRRLCDTDGKLYNIYTLPHEELAKCKGNLLQREDDKEDVVIHRYGLYVQNTLQSIDYLRRTTQVIELDAEPLPEIVFQKVLAVLPKN